MRDRNNAFLASLALAILGLAFGAEATAAQSRGDRATVGYTHTFATSGQGMWGGGANSLEDAFWLVDPSVTGGSDNFSAGVTSFGVSGSAGMNAGFLFDYTLDPGSIAIDYPVGLDVTAPAANTFRAGEWVMLTTNGALDAGAVAVTPLSPAAEIGLNFRFNNHFDLDAELVGKDYDVAGWTFPQIDLPVFRLDATGANQLGSALASASGGVMSHLHVPDISRWQTSANGFQLSTRGVDQFMRIRADMFSVAQDLTKAYCNLSQSEQRRQSGDANQGKSGSKKSKTCAAGTRLPRLKDSWSVGGKAASASIDWTVIALDVDVPVEHHQELTFTPSFEYTFDFGQPLNYRHYHLNSVVSEGVARSVTVPLGDSVSIRTPSASDPFTVLPSFTMSNQLRHHAFERVGTQLNLDLLKIKAGVSIAGVGSSVSADVLDGHNILDTSVDRTIYDQTWALGGFGGAFVPPSGVTLDPESPMIAVETALGPGVASGGPPGSIAQTVTIRNVGDVRLAVHHPLNALASDLGRSAFEVIDVVSPTEQVNARYDGTDENRLLHAALTGAGVPGPNTSGFFPGDSMVFRVLIDASPGGTYDADLDVTAESPIGTVLQADTLTQVAIFNTIDKESSVIAGQRGIIDLAVLDTGDLKIASIDATSVRVEGVVPISVEAGSVDGVQSLGVAVALDEVVRRVLARMDREELLGAALPDAYVVADALLNGSAVVSSSAREALDQIGNGNGRMDLGDLRAYVLGGTPADTASTETLESVVVITGTTDDGTPFFAETKINLIGIGAGQ